MDSDEVRQLISKLIACTEDVECRSLDVVVEEMRRAGNGWRRISKALADRYDVNVPFTTLHGWYAGHDD